MLNSLKRWFGHKPQLSTDQQLRLSDWDALPLSPLDTPFGDSRYIVLDVETTGLNLMHDRLISIGAVAVVNGKIELGESFYVVLQQQAASERENILVHGIGASAQLEGVPPKDALLDFLAFMGKSPLIAFHVTFDETMIRRAISEHLGFNFKHPWVDLAYVMPGLHPPLAKRLRALDDWINHFGIRIDVRHNALADALATAQLLQLAQFQSSQKKLLTFNQLLDLEKAQRWVSAVS